MAQLNVRDRRIEATIAYVGPQLAGRATTFARLREPKDPRIARVVDRATDSADGLSLSWHATDKARFRDCDVQVNVVAPRRAFDVRGGGGRSEGLTDIDDVLASADCVVLVVDAQPASQANNRAAFEALRAALAKRERSHVPLVVQVNKADLPDALPPADVVGALGASEVPHVRASAMQGDGVVDTLEAALLEVVTALQRAPQTNGERHAHTGAGGALRADGDHPLLAALRRVLRDTVQEHVADLETRVVARLEASLAKVEQGLKANDTHEAIKKVDARFDRLRDEVRAQLTAVIETASKSDRDHVSLAATGSITSIKRAIEGMSNHLDSSIKAADAHGSVADVAEMISELAERMTKLERRIEATAEHMTSLPTNFDDSHKAIAERTAKLDEALAERTAKLEEAVRAVRTEMTEQHTTASAAIAELTNSMNEILKELQKPKKGWFA